MMGRKQFWIEEQEKDLRRQIVEELHHYHRARQAWRLGPLKLRRSKGGFLDIWAEYLDIEAMENGKVPGSKPCNV